MAARGKTPAHCHFEAAFAPAGMEPGVVRLSFHKDPSIILGLLISPIGPLGVEKALILEIQPGGLIEQWNLSNPFQDIRAGDAIIEVNGQSDLDGLFRELSRATGPMVLHVQRSPDGSGGVQWKEKGRVGCCKFLAASFADGHAWLERYALVVTPNAQAKDDETEVCAICLQDLEPRCPISRLECRHGFHAGCLAQWLQTDVRWSCPLCKMRVELGGHGSSLDPAAAHAGAE